MPLDDAGDAVAAEGREYGPYLDAAGALGGLRGGQHGVMCLPGGQVGGVGAHRRPQRARVAH
jgi:hypothetical protein